MEANFDVKMNFGTLFDFKVAHAYRQPINLLATAAGVGGILMYIRFEKWYYIVLAILLIVYTPLMLLKNSAIQMKMVAAFKETVHYHMDDEGITVTLGQQSQTVPWESVTKARNTQRSYFLYTSPKSAFILPLKQMGEERDTVLRLMCAHVDPKNIKIRYGGL